MDNWKAWIKNLSFCDQYPLYHHLRSHLPKTGRGRAGRKMIYGNLTSQQGRREAVHCWTQAARYVPSLYLWCWACFIGSDNSPFNLSQFSLPVLLTGYDSSHKYSVPDIVCRLCL